MLTEWCGTTSAQYPDRLKAKGIGMKQGFQFAGPAEATRAANLVVRNRIVIECCGPRDEVLR